jgi:hypothetical protein
MLTQPTAQKDVPPLNQLIRDIEHVRKVLDRTLATLAEMHTEPRMEVPVFDPETGRRAAQKRWQTWRARQAALRAGGDDGAA